jgi:hypothetical protein
LKLIINIAELVVNIAELVVNIAELVSLEKNCSHCPYPSSIVATNVLVT